MRYSALFIFVSFFLISATWNQRDMDILNLRGLTTIERDALSPTAGQVIFNKTDSELQVYKPTGWDGVGSGGGGIFLDDLFRIQNQADPTKKIGFDASLISSGQTRSILMPDFDVNLGNLANLSLNNLSGVSLNTDFLPDVASTREIGSNLLPFAKVYSDSIDFGSLSISDGLIDDTDGSIDFGSTNLTNIGAISAGSSSFTEVQSDDVKLGGNEVTTAVNTPLVLSGWNGLSSVDLKGTNVDLLNNSPLRFRELSANGSNYVELKGPANLASNLGFTLPSIDGPNGYALVTNGAGILSFEAFATAASGPDFADDVFQIKNASDNTKIIEFDASNISTTNTRKIIMADRDIDLSEFSHLSSADFTGIISFVDESGVDVTTIQANHTEVSITGQRVGDYLIVTGKINSGSGFNSDFDWLEIKFSGLTVDAAELQDKSKLGYSAHSTDGVGDMFWHESVSRVRFDFVIGHYDNNDVVTFEFRVRIVEWQ